MATKKTTKKQAVIKDPLDVKININSKQLAEKEIAAYRDGKDIGRQQAIQDHPIISIAKTIRELDREIPNLQYHSEMLECAAREASLNLALAHNKRNRNEILLRFQTRQPESVSQTKGTDPSLPL